MPLPQSSRAQTLWYDVKSLDIHPQTELSSASNQMGIRNSQYRSGLKVSCDGAFKGENDAVGIIVRDINGKVVDGIAKHKPAISSLYSKTTVEWQACLFAPSCIYPMPTTGHHQEQ